MLRARRLRLALGVAALAATPGLAVASGCALVVGADFDDKKLRICDSCYLGPPQTEARGLCVSGCWNDDACEGQVTPRLEDCTTDTLDENCDGARACDGGPAFAKSFGDANDQVTARVAADTEGNAILAVDAPGLVNYGGGNIGGAAGSRVHVAKLNSAGGHVWSRSFLGDMDQHVGGVAVDGNGNIVVSGHFYGTTDVGGGGMVSGGDVDIFVTKMDKDGNHVWSRSAGDLLTQLSTAVAVDRDGNVIVTGCQNSVMPLDAEHVVATVGGLDIFVAKLDPNGTPLWVRGFGDPSDQCAYEVAAGPSGEIAITGQFRGAVDFGGGPYVDGDLQGDGFIAVLEPTAGNHVWSHPLVGCCDIIGYGVAFDGAGRVHVTGRFQGAADFGGAVLTAAGNYDAFLVTYDPAGQIVLSRAFGDATEQFGLSVTVDGGGSVILGGYTVGPIDFGAGAIPTSGDVDAFVAKFDVRGDVIWGRVFGPGGTQVTRALAPEPLGNIFAIGWFDASMLVGDSGLSSLGARDTWLAKLRP